MPSEWQYHADGVQTGLTTRHDLDGSLREVRLQLDTFKVRSWTEEEVEDEDTRTPNHLNYDEQDGLFYEHSGGRHASLKFKVNDAGAAELTSIEPEDGDELKPGHMALLPAAERIVEGIDELDICWSTIETLENEYHNAKDVFIEAVDG